MPTNRSLAALCLSLALATVAAPIDAAARGPRGGGGRSAGAGGGRSFSPSHSPRGGANSVPGRGVGSPHGATPAPRLGTADIRAVGGFQGAAPSGQVRGAGQVQQWLGTNGSAPTAAAAQASAAAGSLAAGRNGQHAQSVTQHLQSAPQPFTPSWYAQHPNAWQATHPHADAAVAATAAGVTAWLAGATYSYAPPATSTTVVYVEEAPSEEVVESAPAAEPAPVVYNQSAPPAEPEDGEWLALGVYHLSPQAGAPATQSLQLSIDRSAQLRGVYYDQVTGASQNVAGAVDQSTGAAWWSPVGGQGALFESTLDELAGGAGRVTVSLPTGKHAWTLQRQ